MDFALNDDQRALQASARRYAQAELPLLAARLERDGDPVPRRVREEYGQLGFLGINTAAALGGLGGSVLDALVVLEEFARISVAVAFPVFESCLGPVRIVERFGTRLYGTASFQRWRRARC